MSFKSRLLTGWVLASMVVVSAACGDDDAKVSTCVPGMVVTCPCAGASAPGTQSCTRSGVFGACECALDAGAVDAGIDAGAPVADLGGPDAGGLDAGALDAGVTDAGSADAGVEVCTPLRTTGSWELVGTSLTPVAEVSTSVGLGRLALGPDGTPHVSWMEGNAMGSTYLGVARLAGDRWESIGRSVVPNTLTLTGQFDFVMSPDGVPWVAATVGTPIASVAVFSWDGEVWVQRGPKLDGLSGESSTGLVRMAIGADAMPVVMWTEAVTVVVGRPVDTSFARRWDGSRWLSLGASIAVTGAPGTDASASLARVNQRGEPMVVFNRSESASSTSAYVARWDGLDWRLIGSPIRPAEGLLSASPSALQETANGDVYLAYNDNRDGYVLRFAGADWDPVAGDIGADDPVDFRHNTLSMVVEPDGTPVIHMASSSTIVSGDAIYRVRRWDGIRWVSLATPPANFTQLVRAGCGPLYGIGYLGTGVSARVVAYRWAD